MTRRDCLAIIRAMREVDARASVVTIDKVSSGAVTFSVKAVGRDVKATAKRAREVFEELDRLHGEAATRRKRQAEIDDEIAAQR